MQDLIEKLEKATGPNRALNEELFVLANGRKRSISSFEQYQPSEPLPDYTGSIDAALTLVPEGNYWTVSGGMDDFGAPRGMEGSFSAVCPTAPFSTSWSERTWTKHPAIALCIAALKARGVNTRLMPMIRVTAAWALYWTGDLVHRLLVNRWPGDRWEWPYRLYAYLMGVACDLQGDDPRGPWGPVER